jgi:hypothetical protein
MLGLYPADEQNPLLKRYSPVWHNPQGALSFLKTDLARFVGESGRPVVLMSHCGFDTDWWHTNDWRVVYEATQPYNIVLYLYGHTGTGLRTWAPPGETKPLPCVNTGQTEKGFFVVRIVGDRLRLAYRTKDWSQERGPDGKPRISWDGTWEWKHALEKPLFAEPKTNQAVEGADMKANALVPIVAAIATHALASKFRVAFTHEDAARSGGMEIRAWRRTVAAGVGMDAEWFVGSQ